MLSVISLIPAATPAIPVANGNNTASNPCIAPVNAVMKPLIPAPAPAPVNEAVIFDILVSVLYIVNKGLTAKELKVLD